MATVFAQKRGLELAFGGLGAFGVASFLGYSLTKPKHSASTLSPELEPGKRREIFDSIANGWDDLTYWDEFFGRIKWYRRRIIKTYAEGKVLEVAAGTGANLDYYDETKIKSLTLMDFSRPMIELARKKFDNAYPRDYLRARFRVGSAEKINFEDNTFDCVVDTFGICSFDNPKLAISEMTRVLKEGGKLILLEHGKTHNGLVQMFLDRSRIMNLHKYGCDCNRDMIALVRSEKRLGEMKLCERKQFGHIYLLVVVKNSTCIVDSDSESLSDVTVKDRNSSKNNDINKSDQEKLSSGNSESGFKSSDAKNKSSCCNCGSDHHHENQTDSKS